MTGGFRNRSHGRWAPPAMKDDDMIKRVLRGTVLIGLALVLTNLLAGCPLAPVNIPDKNLKLALRKATNMPLGVLTKSVLAKVSTLEAPDSGIADLTGLEHCTQLTTLDLRRNQIASIGPLEGLASLQYLDLGGNTIANIQPLGGLYALTFVSLWGKGNEILDFSPLVTNAEGGGLIEGKAILPAEYVLTNEGAYLPLVAADMNALKDAGVTVQAVTEEQASAQ